jgi:hypothetical protein
MRNNIDTVNEQITMRKIENVVDATIEKQGGGLYCTADGLAFLDEHEAAEHASCLNDQTIRSVTQEEANAEISSMISSWHEQMEELLYDLNDERDQSIY